MSLSVGAIPFNTKPYKNISGISTTNSSERYMNGIMVPDDKGGFVSKRRPGMLEFIDLGTGSPIDGVYWWQKKGVLISVSAGVVYKTTSTTGTTINLGGVALNTGTRVIFAEARRSGTDYLFMCNGGQIAYTDGTTALAYVSDADAPTTCTFIQFMDQSIVANDTTTDRFYYSETGDPLSWSSLDFVTAESNFDRSVSILVKNRNIIIFGEASTEFWQNDGVTPFRRRSDIFINEGTFSPYAIADTPVGIFFMNNNREIKSLSITGQTTKVSTPYDLVFQALTTVTNAYADNYIVGGKGFYVITFPTDSRTFAYDYINDYWSEWAYWSSSDFARYRGNNYVYAAGWNFHIVGDYNDDKLYKVSFDYYNDNGTLMKWLRLTGNVDHGNPMSRKMNVKTQFKIKSGHSITDSAMPYYMYRKNPDSRGWSNEHQLPVQKIGNTYPEVEVHRQGHYKMMQHELSCTDNIDVEVSDVIEMYQEFR